jgi:xanthine dehydrogenase accessory factor
MSAAIVERAQDLSARRVPFVRATVVRAQVPTSAHAGDGAIILTDGSIEGFVGGQCAENSVRTAALATLADGEALLLRVLPDGDVDFPETPGAQIVVNPCLSGGALEIFLQPILPPPLIAVLGQTPVADAVVAVSELLGYATVRSAEKKSEQWTFGASAVVVASHGRGEEATIRAALDAGVTHIALVASGRRGQAVLDELGLTEEERGRVKTPAGLSIGARTPAEVALSIMAEVVSELRSGGPVPVPGAAAPIQIARLHPIASPLSVTDPICGMTVTIGPDIPHLVVEGSSSWFCSDHCRTTFAAKGSH